jgi:hypothetical protein
MITLREFMRRYGHRSVRAIIYTSAILTLLSLVAPWLWRAISIGPTLVSDAGRQPREPETLQSVLQRPESDSLPDDPIPSGRSRAVSSVEWHPEPTEVAGQRDDALTELQVEPILGEVMPPVTERIDLDPSLAEPPDRRPAPKPPSLSEADEPSDMPTPDDLEAPLPRPIDRTPAVVPPKSAGVWPHAEALQRQLLILAEESPIDSAWTQRVKSQLDALIAMDSLASSQVPDVLSRLAALAEEAYSDRTPQPPTRQRTLRQRAAFAIARRVVIWELAYEAASAVEDERPAPVFNRAALNAALAEIDPLLRSVAAGKSWRAYLRLPELSALASGGGLPDAESRELMRDVLRRLDSPRLDQQQHDFLSRPPFCQLAESLRPSAHDPVDLGGLLAALEEREAHDGSLISQQVAQMYQVLRWSSDEKQVQLADAINDNYRNANVRVALSAELLNRFIPPPQIMAEPVVDTIRGADVVGRSESVARLRIVLLPDRLRWRLGLEAHGNVASETESSKGPARFWNDGLGAFYARKEVTLDRRGLAVARAHANADSEAFLKDFETDFEGVPLLNHVARAIARGQYESEQPAARTEISEKISQKASQRLDVEVDQRVVQAEREFKQKLIAPLDRLNLEPTPVDMETTERRLIVRYRLAGPHQLSAYTPRPQAPGNSMVSLQLHESMFNNTLENLKLADRRVDLRTLYVEMLRRFEAKEIKIPEDLPEDVTVHFAERDPVRISCEEGRVKLTIRLKELDHAERHTWKDFEVHGYYRPSDNQLEANLVRDGNLELVGERLKLGDQIALRGIFAKVLSRNRQLSIINKQLLARPQLADLQVTQFVIQDGWIGVALGPKSDNLRPAPAPVVDAEEAEVTRRPLRNLLHGLR